MPTPHQSISSFQEFPGDLNFGNTLFGGKMLAESDCEGAKVARSVIYGTEADNVVTASMERVNFMNPAYQGDLIVMIADVISFGKSSSMKIIIDSYIKKGPDKENWIPICKVFATFVSMKDGKPFPHGQIEGPTGI